jgi:hypothetical protein
VSIPDPIAEIRTLLLADTDVASLAGTRVYGDDIAEGDQGSMPQATVVLREAGGPGRLGFTLYRRTRIDTLCYGKSLSESAQLHRYVREVLETMNRPTGTLFTAEVSSDGRNGRDPDTQRSLCIASYLVMSATDP